MEEDFALFRSILMMFCLQFNPEYMVSEALIIGSLKLLNLF